MFHSANLAPDDEDEIKSRSRSQMAEEANADDDQGSEYGGLKNGKVRLPQR